MKLTAALVTGFFLANGAQAFSLSTPRKGLIHHARQQHLAALKASRSGNESTLQNDGIFSWMIPFLEMGGFDEGKTVKYGVIPSVVDDSVQVSVEESARLKAQASAELTVIGPVERARRLKAGNYILLATTAVACWVCLFNDSGDFIGHLNRLALYPLVFLGLAFRASGKTGM